MSTASKAAFWRLAAVAGAVLLCTLAAVGLAMLAVAAPTETPIYVRADGDDASCDGTENAAHSVEVEPDCAVSTINQGISLLTSGGTLFVGEGVYYENVAVNRDLALHGAGAGSTIIDAGGSGRAVCLTGGADATISGVTIRNGSAATVGGGGIYLASSNVLTLTDSTVSSNVACSDCDGGGLYTISLSTVVISNCSFIDNTASGRNSLGGAIFNWTNSLTVVASTFTGNTAGELGGAIYSGGFGNSVTVIDSTLSDNHVAGATTTAGAPFIGRTSACLRSATRPS
jgi:hypothetical protein